MVPVCRACLDLQNDISFNILAPRGLRYNLRKHVKKQAFPHMDMLHKTFITRLLIKFSVIFFHVRVELFKIKRLRAYHGSTQSFNDLASLGTDAPKSFRICSF